MSELKSVTMPTALLKEMLALLQAIRREAENRGVVEIVELTDRCAALAGGALKRETI